MTGIGFGVMLLVSLIDREGSYGPRGDSRWRVGRLAAGPGRSNLRPLRV